MSDVRSSRNDPAMNRPPVGHFRPEADTIGIGHIDYKVHDRHARELRANFLRHLTRQAYVASTAWLRRPVLLAVRER